MRFPRQLPAMVALVTGLVFATPASGAQTTVVVTSSGGLADLSGVQLVTLGADGVLRRVAGNTIDLDSDTVVTCVGDDVWCPRIPLVDPDVERIMLPAYPRASVSVVLQLPFGETWTNEPVQVEGWLYEDGQTEAALPFTESASVTATGGRLEALWSGPKGALDLRLTVAGWMPHYWFDVDATGGVVELGEARMSRSASVSAFAVDMGTGLPLVGAMASLEAPQGLLGDRRSERLRVSGATNERGFVQLRDVEPGGYNLVLEAEGKPPIRLSGVETEGGRETWLGDVLVPGYSKLTIHVDPPSDDGAPWRIDVERLLPPWDATTGTTDALGVLVQRELVPGPYSVDVYDTRGNQLSSESLSVERDNHALSVTIRLSRVRGRVLLGRDGIQATVELSTGAGAWTTFETDEEGRFEGRVLAPTEDEFLALIDAETVSRELEVEPILREGVHEVTLQVGAFEIGGVVLDRETGFPLEGASVELMRPTETESGPTLDTADLDGQFLFQGLDDEPHVVSAYLDGYSRSRQENVRPSEVSEDDDAVPAVTLFLREGTEVEVLVISENGTPQRGANLWVLTLTPDGVGLGTTVTSLSGQGRLVVPRSVTPAAVVVRPPTGVLWSGCVQIPEEGSTMEIRVPSGPGGTLLLTPSGQPKTVTTPEQALVSIDGGLLTLEALGLWMNDQGVPFADDGRLTVPRVASNHYSVADISGLGLAAYPAACQGAVRPLAPWEFLVAAGEMELPMRFSLADEVLFWNLP